MEKTIEKLNRAAESLKNSENQTLNKLFRTAQRNIGGYDSAKTRRYYEKAMPLYCDTDYTNENLVAIKGVMQCLLADDDYATYVSEIEKITAA